MCPTISTRSRPERPVEGSAASEAMLVEERLCAVLLGSMVLLLFLQAAIRNCGALGRTPLGAWFAHATEVLPAGLTWLTFLGCGAVTRRRELLKISVITARCSCVWQERLEVAVWALWLSFFAVLGALGLWATYSQRHQMTSLAWLPQWAVALSIPLGSALVVWRSAQVIAEIRADSAGRAGGHSDGC